MKKILIIISLFICLTLLFTGCGGSTKPINSDNSESVDDTSKEDAGEEDAGDEDAGDEDAGEEDIEEEVTEGDTSDSNDTDDSDDAEVVKVSEINTISKFSDYWNYRYTQNEQVINDYDAMPIMELVTPGLSFLSGIQYELLNMDNVDGRFEGELMFSGYQGFVEKKGAKYTFGYEDELTEDGFMPSDKKGDKKIEKGSCDLDDGHYFTDSYTERDGAVINRSTSEFQIEKDEGVSTIDIEGRTMNYNNEAELSNSYVFIRNGVDQYDFVIATSQIGTDFEVITLEEDMTKEKAIAMFEAAGATIDKTGGIVNGVLVKD